MTALYEWPVETKMRKEAARRAAKYEAQRQEEEEARYLPFRAAFVAARRAGHTITIATTMANNACDAS
jgi:hypothetical protein